MFGVVPHRVCGALDCGGTTPLSPGDGPTPSRIQEKKTMKRSPTQTAFLVSALALCCACRIPPCRAAAPPAVIIADGEPRCSVVVAESAAQRPAEELADYLEKASGAVVPVSKAPQPDQAFRILVGGQAALEAARGAGIAVDRKTWDSLPGDGYVIRSSPKALLLAGKTELGMFYAVDTFLENELGVRWFMPDGIGLVVPETRTVSVGALDEVGRPAFRMRWIGRGHWARRNKMNVNVACDGEFKIKWFVHTFTRLLPPAQYYDEHPEYFAYVGGRRVTMKKRRDQIQTCTSNPGVIAETARNIIGYKEADPALSMVSLDPMDIQRFCECPQCLALDEEGTVTNNSRTRRLLLFYNAVGDIVTRAHPDLVLKSIAYHVYVAPPLDPAMRVNDSSVIQFCRFTCHNHALEDPACPYNREFNKYIRGWRDIAENVCLYEYYFKASWVQLPWPIVHMLKTDIPYYHRLKLFGLATQYTVNYGSNGLPYYVAAKLLWDPALDVEALVDDFCTRFYVEASAPMREYYDTLENGALASGVHIARQRPYAEVVKLFTPEFLASLDACVSRAEQAAVDETVKKRIALVRASLEYARVLSDYLRAMDKARRAGDAPWISPAGCGEAEKLAPPHIEKIKQALAAGVEIKATKGPKDLYVSLLYDPKAVVRLWDRSDIGFGSAEKAIQRAEWLASAGRQIEPRPRPATFSLWLHGYDWDSDEEKSEHEVRMVNASGEKVRIGPLAPPGDHGNVTDKCFAFTGLSAAELLADKATVLLVNPAGEWTASTLFAAYVMPDEPGLTSQQATDRIRNELDKVRNAAFGFIEAVGSGMLNRDGETLALEIELGP